MVEGRGSRVRYLGLSCKTLQFSSELRAYNSGLAFKVQVSGFSAQVCFNCVSAKT